MLLVEPPHWVSRTRSGVAAAAHSPLPQGCQTDTACPTVTAAGSAARWPSWSSQTGRRSWSSCQEPKYRRGETGPGWRPDGPSWISSETSCPVDRKFTINTLSWTKSKNDKFLEQLPLRERCILSITYFFIFMVDLHTLTVDMALTMPLVIWSCRMCFTTSNWAALCLGMIWSAIFFSSELNFLNRSSNSSDRS